MQFQVAALPALPFFIGSSSRAVAAAALIFLKASVLENTNISLQNMRPLLNYLCEAFWDMIVAFFQQGQNVPDLGWGKLTLFVKSMKTCPYP